MKPKIAAELFAQLAETFQSPKTELQFDTHFELLVAVMLSAQATDISVNQATEKLFKVANTPEKMIRIGENGLKPYIRTIGLYNSKATHIIQTSSIILNQHNGEVPNTRPALESLPGVGRKTANVVLNVAFNQPTIAVDTHVFRVANRTGLAHAKTPLKVEEQLIEITPLDHLANAHHYLILLGRYTCKARKPNCPSCPIQHLCEYKNKSQR